MTLPAAPCGSSVARPPRRGETKSTMTLFCCHNTREIGIVFKICILRDTHAPDNSCLFTTTERSFWAVTVPGQTGADCETRRVQGSCIYESRGNCSCSDRFRGHSDGAPLSTWPATENDSEKNLRTRLKMEVNRRRDVVEAEVGLPNMDLNSSTLYGHHHRHATGAWSVATLI